MKKFRSVPRILAVLLLAVLALPAPAQFAIPTSNNVIEGELKLPGIETPVQFFAREGTMVSIRSEENNYWYGIILTLDKKTSGQSAKFSTFKLTPHPAGAPDVVEVASGSQAGFGESAPIYIKDHRVDMELSAAHAWQFSKVPLIDPRGVDPQQLRKIYGTSGGGLCSLSCGAVTITASEVRIPNCGVCQGYR